jgi:hypothetical protein
MIVCVETAIWVKAAPTVAVAALAVGLGVRVASAITGVLVGGTVFVAGYLGESCATAVLR